MSSHLYFVNIGETLNIDPDYFGVITSIYSLSVSTTAGFGSRDTHTKENMHVLVKMFGLSQLFMQSKSVTQSVMQSYPNPKLLFFFCQILHTPGPQEKLPNM